LDCCLIAAGWTDPSLWFAALEVALGLGFIIFVHELGHFAVAKMCGVKVDKFFIGFDIGGLKVCSFRWGETLYGIGILPLGGYVKMLGQEDNPAQLRKEMERARQEAAANPAAGGTDGGAGDAGQAPDSGEPSAEKRLYDPRSYLAKSVPQRMAIISAGVIMNLISALLFATVAFLIGVNQNPTIVGGVMAGSAAWQAGIRADDEVLEVAGHKVGHFRRMTQEVVTGDLAHGIPLLIKRPGIEKPLEIVVKPEQLGGAPRIGVFSSCDLKIVNEKNVLPFLVGLAAADAKGPLMPGDRIVQINNQTISTFGQLQDFLVAHADEDLTVTVARLKQRGAKGDQSENVENVQVIVPKSPMKQFGLVMEMGPIAAVETESPAAKAGILPGDLLKTVDGKPVADPMRLPDELHKRAGAEVTLGLKRAGKPLELKVKLLSAPRYAPSELPDSPVAISELGIAYFVLNTVARVEPGSPAAGAGMQAGDKISQAVINPPSAEELADLCKQYQNNDLGQIEFTIPFKDDERNWPVLLTSLQGGLPGTTVRLTWHRGDNELSQKLTPVRAKDWFDMQRGWNLEPMMFVQKARDFSDALRLGAVETADATLLVYRTLHGVVGTKQISVRNFSGPWGIIKMALMQARLGFGNFLIFLTLISANLAVINFLPIPVLDGGHMMLLLYEGIRGKPADERVQEVLTWIGLIFILSLMIFVFGLDFGWISRPGAH
jgi:regulator of sigma E protease